MSKNKGKRLEDCSKSHFSHFRNKLEKVSLRPLILERFLEPKSSQDREKVISKSLQKSSQFSNRFFIDLGGSPRATLKLIIFHQFLLLVSLLGHLGAKRVPKVLQDSSRGRFSLNLVPFWGRFCLIFQ
mgnify:CR=1 FL=1